MAGQTSRKSLAGLPSGTALHLSDPGAPEFRAELRVIREHREEPRFWIRSLSDAPFRMGDLVCREAQWPTDLRVQLGEASFALTCTAPPSLLPVAPAGCLDWYTADPLGYQVLRRTHQAAQSMLATYLCGETGVGKEILAHLIHAWSDRARGPFVALHCAALPLSLAESELFGHVRGAFTGASNNRPGALLQAHNGTLFLDEVGDLPPEIQVKLLRFLENGEIRPVGSDRISHVNVRVVSATHQSLKELVEAGKFRRDLYYRIASLTIPVPALRDRPADIDLLAKKFAALHECYLSEAAIDRLRAHPWSGNARELKHAVERASESTPRSCLLENDFDFLPEAESNPDLVAKPKLTLRELERELLIRTLLQNRGNRAGAARDLGVSRSTVFQMIRRHGIVTNRQFTMNVLK